MENKIKNNLGITMIALMITVIVMMIIASIAVYEGKEIINKSKIQTLQTNMLTIQAKAKAYSEEIDSQVWALTTNKDAKRKELLIAKGLEETVNPYEYKITSQGLVNMGLSNIKDEEYIIVFNQDDFSVKDIVFVKGIRYKDIDYHTLSQIWELLNSDE